MIIAIGLWALGILALFSVAALVTAVVVICARFGTQLALLGLAAALVCSMIVSPYVLGFFVIHGRLPW